MVEVPMLFPMAPEDVNKGYKLAAAEGDDYAVLQLLRDKNVIDENDTFIVLQDANGRDIEDRILKGKELISHLIDIDADGKALTSERG